MLDTKKKVIFTGCSFTAGNGWDSAGTHLSAADSASLWVNLCHSSIPVLQACELINCGTGGGSNQEIFNKTIELLSLHKDNIDMLFVQWTSGPRYNFNAGFELWNTSESVSANSSQSNRKHDIKLSNGTSWPRKYVQDLLDRFRVLHHPHWEILQVVKFTNIIRTTAHALGVNHVFFINGLCPWDNNYFTELGDIEPMAWTPYTRDTIIEIDYRSDTDANALYRLLHQHYRNAGGIENSNWINLYDSFLSNQVDYNFDNAHPGTKSNLIYAKLVQTALAAKGLA